MPQTGFGGEKGGASAPHQGHAGGHVSRLVRGHAHAEVVAFHGANIEITEKSEAWVHLGGAVAPSKDIHKLCQEMRKAITRGRKIIARRYQSGGPPPSKGAGLVELPRRLEHSSVEFRRGISDVREGSWRV
ncbi:MAG: hypothetical protein KGO51_12440, partial [Alphaproteobacteria bacterium]|nr:hypothetical protein [Alphaproteobacteria bacterium]